MKYPLRIMRILKLCILSVLVAAQAVAQSPTPEQLDIFRNLSAEQQQIVLQQIGSQQGGATTAQSREGADRQVAGTEVADRRQAGRTDAKPTLLDLHAKDTVLVELSLPGNPTNAANGATPAGVAPESVPGRSEALEAARQRRIRMVTALDGEGRKKLEDLVTQVLARNPYELDGDAQLNLPGLAPIALGGLTEEQATQRLSLEPVLLPLEVHVSRLPLSRQGPAGLKSFGHDLFENPLSTFSPVTDVPVPADYVIGPGDGFNVQLFGSQNRNHRLTVNRDGEVNFPELGPIRVGGMTFNEARRLIESRVAQRTIGVQVSVSMGDTRTIRVYVMGEARQPGSYTVSGLATMITALFASGGVKPIGSLRDIQLKRQGEVVRRFDLYDMLIHGDTSADAKLLPGDVIFIPPEGPTVSVDGEVKRPAKYELRNETSVADVVRMAGGLTSDSDPARVSLTRIDEGGRRVVLDVNLGRPVGRAQSLGNGDILRVARLRPQIDAGVVLDGFVHRPGLFAWREGLRLTDVIGSVDELRPGADQHYVLLRRESGPDRRLSVLSADLAAALADPTSAANVTLAPRDRIVVFDLAPGRERIISPILEELRLQSDLSRPTEVVRIGGKAKVPGTYPLEAGMRVGDLLRAGGNLDPSAFGGNAELTRYSIDKAGARLTELIEIDLAGVRAGQAAANLLLQPFDYLVVKETPNWSGQESVTLRGEVQFPGTYPIRRGETLRQLLDRAGGLTPLAFPEGGAFIRGDLRILEQQQLDRLAQRMRTDLASLSLQAANAGQASASESLRAGQSLLAELQGSKATGRFLIDLPTLMSLPPGSEKDVVLRDGDELVVPKRRQEVTVIGEVQNSSSHLFLSNLKRSDYLAMSGGTTKKADSGRIYVVRADGRTATRSGSWLSRNYDVAIKPGDTIVVPLDTERMPKLPFWQAVTQILYNVAVSVAAINSF